MKKLALLVVLLVSFMAFAADTPPQRPQGQRGGGFVTAVDTNKDGKLSKAEVDAWFVKADTNKDGAVDQDEFRASMPQMGPRGQGGQGRGPGGPAPQ